MGDLLTLGIGGPMGEETIENYVAIPRFAIWQILSLHVSFHHEDEVCIQVLGSCVDKTASIEAHYHCSLQEFMNSWQLELVDFTDEEDIATYATLCPEVWDSFAQMAFQYRSSDFPTTRKGLENPEICEHDLPVSICPYCNIEKGAV